MLGQEWGTRQGGKQHCGHLGLKLSGDLWERCRACPTVTTLRAHIPSWPSCPRAATWEGREDLGHCSEILGCKLSGWTQSGEGRGDEGVHAL